MKAIFISKPNWCKQQTFSFWTYLIFPWLAKACGSHDWGPLVDNDWTNNLDWSQSRRKRQPECCKTLPGICKVTTQMVIQMCTELVKNCVNMTEWILTTWNCIAATCCNMLAIGYHDCINTYDWWSIVYTFQCDQDTYFWLLRFVFQFSLVKNTLN